LTKKEANRLASLPLKCISQTSPYHLSLVVEDGDELKTPQAFHPAFYGCFDWHSAVHGHWSLVWLLKRFPALEQRDEIIKAIDKNLTKEHLATEVAYFSYNKYTKNFERPYGWAWLLRLCAECKSWAHPKGQEWATNLLPLEELITEKVSDYLAVLSHPIRVGTHTNTAFALKLILDYCAIVKEEVLPQKIKEKARSYFGSDKKAPIDWEPSGYDFLSPSLIEASLMKTILPNDDFAQWLNDFLPQLNDPQTAASAISPLEITDRTDGHIVHLDGLNLSRAWCLYAIAQHPLYGHLKPLATTHFETTLPRLTDGHYAGEHWLASFALLVFETLLEEDDLML